MFCWLTLFPSVLGSGRARQVPGKNGRKLSLGVGDFISFLFDAVYGFVVVICFTKRTLTFEQDLHLGLGWGAGEGREKSRVLSPYMESLLVG